MLQYLRKNKEFYFGFITIFIIVLQWCLCSRINSDSEFLYNRACLLFDCIKDGKYPYIYYTALENLGYGSSFFYGQLTLLPFLPFLFNIKVFVTVYYTTAIVTNYVGLSYFAKRFTKNNITVAYIFITSILFLTSPMHCNIFALGMSWFFLAKCVDYFGGSSSFVPASLLFFLILNTHLISAFMSFLVCIVLFIYYLDYRYLGSYIKFACFTCLICSYNLLNYYYHKDSITLVQPLEFVGITTRFTISSALFGSNFLRMCTVIFSNLHIYDYITLTSLSVFIICMVCFFKKFTIKKFLIICACFMAFFIGTNNIWEKIIKYVDVFFQFPIRYLYYFLVAFLIACLKDIDLKRGIKVFIFIFCLVDIVLGRINVVYDNNSSYIETKYDIDIANGEYLSKNFIKNLDLFNELKSEAKIIETDQSLDFHYEKDKLIVNIPEHTGEITVRVPKLFYKGYKTSNKYIKCYEGYSQFTEMKIDKFTGELEVYYSQPFWLRLIQLLCSLVIIVTLLKLFRRELKNE